MLPVPNSGHSPPPKCRLWVSPVVTLTLNDAIELVLALPAAVVLVDETGIVAAASVPARHQFGDDLPGRRLADVDHRELHPATELRCDGRTMQLAGIASSDTGPFTTARVAHDFNNLLGVVINYAALASAGLPAGSPVADDLREVLAAARRASALTHQLMYAEHAPAALTTGEASTGT